MSANIHALYNALCQIRRDILVNLRRMSQNVRRHSAKKSLKISKISPGPIFVDKLFVGLYLGRSILSPSNNITYDRNNDKF